MDCFQGVEGAGSEAVQQDDMTWTAGQCSLLKEEWRDGGVGGWRDEDCTRRGPVQLANGTPGWGMGVGGRRIKDR